MHINSQQCMNYHFHVDYKVEFINWVNLDVVRNILNFVHNRHEYIIITYIYL